ncbi:MAG: transposase [Altererythrobacter sp. XM-24bin4]|nr:MAG: transposase [Candidatus Aquiluna sp. XM-24bin5]PWL23551.1 MAG: transposase [Altererythrobacter sp. XM-24bin4]
METIRGFVYSLKPTSAQEHLLTQTAGVVRLVYNLALEQRRIWGGRPYGGGAPRYFGSKGLSGELSDLREAYDWIRSVSQTAQNQALVDLDRAFTNFFEGRAGYPTPRRKYANDAFRQAGREIQTRKINKRWSEVKIPKIGWVKYRDTRALPHAEGCAPDIRNATIRRTASGWEISIAVRYEIEDRPVPSAAQGVDRGVAIPFALSDGTTWLLPEAMEARQKTIRRGQKIMSRRQRGSKRYAKARRRVARLKARDARTRAHLHHVLSRHLADTCGMVAIEDLKTCNMTASAKGTVEEPGKNVRQKAGLNGSILNVGWYGFELKLSYKMEETGGIIVKVDPRNTSRTCAECGAVDKESRKSQAAFVCTTCGAAENADINAAKNILARALRSPEQEKAVEHVASGRGGQGVSSQRSVKIPDQSVHLDGA